MVEASADGALTLAVAVGEAGAVPTAFAAPPAVSMAATMATVAVNFEVRLLSIFYLP
ncbi:hypothetical protein [Clavibacter michiganensis]|uniref:hypothetical protein n=1 Tax=Clavibacter michiganensis TaxID=28447 RepID=UPI0015E1DA46|nr:hypothetical protein [Clavibacter michiganensis]